MCNKMVYKISSPYCIHGTLKTKWCNPCRIKSKCKCSKQIFNCSSCGSNKTCKHSRKRARCPLCFRKIDKLCLLTDYQKGEFVNEQCACFKCKKEQIMKKKMDLENSCIICNEFKKFSMDRCQKCYENYNKTLIIEIENEKIESNKEDSTDYIRTLNSFKSCSEILGDLKTENKKILLFVNRVIQKINTVNILIENRSNSNINIEFYLLRILFHFSTSVKRNIYELQLRVCSEKSAEIINFINYCRTNYTLYLSVRILWFLVKNNTAVMREMQNKYNVIQILNDIKDKLPLDNGILNTVIDIILHYKNYNICYKYENNKNIWNKRSIRRNI